MAGPGVSGFRLEVSAAERQRERGQDGYVGAMSDGTSSGQQASV